MQKAIKYLSVLLMLCLSMSLASCSDDDDEPESTIDDWYSECTSVTGGGWSPQECSQFMNFLNTDTDLELGPDYQWSNIERDQAIYYFDRQMRVLSGAFSSGISGVSGTLYIAVALKNSKGKIIKTVTLKVTSSGCQME